MTRYLLLERKDFGNRTLFKKTGQAFANFLANSLQDILTVGS